MGGVAFEIYVEVVCSHDWSRCKIRFLSIDFFFVFVCDSSGVYLKFDFIKRLNGINL